MILFLRRHFICCNLKENTLFVYDSINGYLSKEEISLQVKNDYPQLKFVHLVMKNCGQQIESPKKHCGFYAAFNTFLLVNGKDPSDFDLSSKIADFRKICVITFLAQGPDSDSLDMNQLFLEWVEENQKELTTHTEIED